MQTKIIFKADAKLKTAIAKKARAQGLTLSTVLTLASHAYIDNRFRIEGFEDKLALSVAQADAGLFVAATDARRRVHLP